MLCSFNNCNLIIQVADASRLYVLRDRILLVDMNMTLTLLILKMSRFLQTHKTEVVADAGRALAAVLITAATTETEVNASNAVPEAAAGAAQVEVAETAAGTVAATPADAAGVTAEMNASAGAAAVAAAAFVAAQV